MLSTTAAAWLTSSASGSAYCSPSRRTSLSHPGFTMGDSTNDGLCFRRRLLRRCLTLFIDGDECIGDGEACCCLRASRRCCTRRRWLALMPAIASSPACKLSNAFDDIAGRDALPSPSCRPYAAQGQVMNRLTQHQACLWWPCQNGVYEARRRPATGGLLRRAFAETATIKVTCND